ncbi:DUF4189 domain-containing protein [Undibacterium danionis]|uniref:DUF4189 domain-containing protein n=1 Tax=Undibacterium danionis TaxID=1812100 RepID=A0ABV6IHL1_9BURK
MKDFTIALLVVASSLITNSAIAWTAVAHSRESGYIQTYYGASTAAEAEKGALEGCSKKALNCVLVGATVNGPVAVVIAKGDGGMGRANSNDPFVAAKNALNECQEIAKNCRLVQAAWDGGTNWFALARSDGNFYATYNYGSQEVAEKDALKGCETQVKESLSPSDKCKLFASIGEHLWYARVSSKTYIGIATANSYEKALDDARKGCQNGLKPNEKCDKEDVIENKGALSEPIEFKKLEAIIEAEQNVKPKSIKTSNTDVPVAKIVRYSDLCQNSSCVRKYEDGRTQRYTACLNPATMLPMNDPSKLGGCGGTDSQGNPFGLK